MDPGSSRVAEGFQSQTIAGTSSEERTQSANPDPTCPLLQLPNEVLSQICSYVVCEDSPISFPVTEQKPDFEPYGLANLHRSETWTQWEGCEIDLDIFADGVQAKRSEQKDLSQWKTMREYSSFRRRVAGMAKIRRNAKKWKKLSLFLTCQRLSAIAIREFYTSSVWKFKCPQSVFYFFLKLRKAGRQNWVRRALLIVQDRIPRKYLPKLFWVNDVSAYDEYCQFISSRLFLPDEKGSIQQCNSLNYMFPNLKELQIDLAGDWSLDYLHSRHYYLPSNQDVKGIQESVASLHWALAKYVCIPNVKIVGGLGAEPITESLKTEMERAMERADGEIEPDALWELMQWDYRDGNCKWRLAL